MTKLSTFCIDVTFRFLHCMGRKPTQARVYKNKVLRTVFQVPVLALVVFLKNVCATKNNIAINSNGTSRSAIQSTQTQQFTYHTKSTTSFGLYIAIIRLTTKKKNSQLQLYTFRFGLYSQTDNGYVLADTCT